MSLRCPWFIIRRVYDEIYYDCSLYKWILFIRSVCSFLNLVIYILIVFFVPKGNLMLLNLWFVKDECFDYFFPNHWKRPQWFSSMIAEGLFGSNCFSVKHVAYRRRGDDWLASRVRMPLCRLLPLQVRSIKSWWVCWTLQNRIWLYRM